MDHSVGFDNPGVLASAFDVEVRGLALRNTPKVRAIRRNYSRLLKGASPAFVLEAARVLLAEYGYRWPAYELIANHSGAFAQIGEAELEALGQGMDSWGAVDTFGRILAGPAWLQGQVPDKAIERWARSQDLWWRRAALVSTVALNMRSQGGYGDVERTLRVCRLLVDDHKDMVVKALSWALRVLVVHDEQAVAGFLEEYEAVLAARVKREVWNKIRTGLKNPRRGET